MEVESSTPLERGLCDNPNARMKEDPRYTNQYFYTVRPAVLKQAKGKCSACRRRVGPGTSRKTWECHHILPISCGGTNALDNLVCLCVECHRFVHAGDITYKRKLSRREYFIGRDILSGKGVVRWSNYRLVKRESTTKNPRLRKLRKLASAENR